MENLVDIKNHVNYFGQVPYYDNKSKNYKMGGHCVDTQSLVLALDWDDAENLIENLTLLNL